MTPAQALSLSLLVAGVVFGLKWLAYLLTGSVALYSDALESVVNIVAAAVALFAVRVSRRPADHNHPYGHTKAEYLSAVLEGVLIVLAALAIVREAWPRLLEPEAVEDLGLGLLVSLAASSLNALLGWFLIARGRRTRSPAVVADGKHVLTDVLTSVGVILGMGLAGLTGWWLLDPLLAIFVATNILWVGWRLVRDSLGGLMDEGLPEVELSEVREALRYALEGLAAEGRVLEVHDLRTRRAGPRTFVEFHLVVPGETTVEQAHQICDRLEGALQARLEGLQTTIHVEPDHKAKHATFRIG
ncbi:MAG: cation diffusion facilitator family transporter [Meiothermus sp.]|uniref:cation diffusion facilitator family transporter n=1 Tax=Meiothermus sp. TaxID=1955249 RepID=UPI0025DB3F51|nr:cation diffusion facilitator family transporter [Meiothermus sp.]MCS7057603.1 cation diffusion facilitator family transporter [Meiothermus sp.]MCS7193955.1 cation diffusion facilitator family transporter [Meiothermus sp.]MCX7740385.1 cation diffusion facilitator family transporter [Meiothermus sp.]MDW8090759.1 cation diffusion facilitator family transporter [Meiothermus sp.]MDW8480817.1 cation diffusion facilitator family transporter [Meiothermus sp.]